MGTLDDLDERTQDAWAAYLDGLRDLDEADYAEAEEREWEILQQELHAIERQRALFATAAPG